MEPLLLQPLQAVEDGVVFKGRGNDVRLALLFPQHGPRKEGLIVGLAPPEVNVISRSRAAFKHFATSCRAFRSTSAASWPVVWREEGLPQARSIVSSRTRRAVAEIGVVAALSA